MTKAIIHRIGPYVIVEEPKRISVPIFLPFQETGPDDLRSFFTWTLEAAIVAAIMYQKRGYLDTAAVGLIGHIIGYRDEDPRNDDPKRTAPYDKTEKAILGHVLAQYLEP